MTDPHRESVCPARTGAATLFQLRRPPRRAGTFARPGSSRGGNQGTRGRERLAPGATLSLMDRLGRVRADGGLMVTAGQRVGTLLVGQRGAAAGRDLARPDGAHRGVEEAGRRAADGAAAQHRRRRAGRPGRARRRAAGGVRLPDRVLPLLAGTAKPRRLHLRAVRGELHRAGPGRRPGVHRRPLPDRRRGVRGDPAAGHLLPGRHPDGRPPDPRAAGFPPPARVLPPRADRGPGGGRAGHHQARRRPRGHDRRRDGRPAVPARAPPAAAAAGAAHPGAQRRVENLVPGDARPARGARRATPAWPKRPRRPPGPGSGRSP